MRNTIILFLGMLSAIWLCACLDMSAVEKKELTNHVVDWRDEIIYQVMIDRFANGDPNNDYNVYADAPAAYHGGDYQGVIDRLDYLDELGVTTLWISPVVKNVEEDAGVGGYHGYWTQNFIEVNPHFGDMAKLREMVDACHARGIKVILDIVTNHIGQLFYYDINKNGYPNELVMGSGDKSPMTRTTEWDPDFDMRGIQAFTSLGASGLAPIEWVWQPEINRVPPWPPEFANPDWYNRMGRVTVWGRELDACLNAGVITEEDAQAEIYWGALPACKEYIRFQEVKGDFPGGLKDIKTERQDVRQAMVEAFTYWIEAADFDGFRIDTLKHVEHGFWQYFCPQIRENAKKLGKNNFFMFGEAFDSDDQLIGSYTKNGEVDSVFYFSQKFQVFDAIFKQGAATTNIERIWSYRLPEMGNDEGVKYYGQHGHTNGPQTENGALLAPYQLLVNFLDNHDLPRFLFVDDGGQDLPCIPEGQSCSKATCENGDWDLSRECRTTDGSYSCDCDIRTLRNALVMLLTMDGIPCINYGTEQNFNGGNDPANREDLWRSGYATDGATFQWIKRLNGLRSELAPLRRGDMKIVWSTDSIAEEQDAGMFAFERSYKGETVLVVINTSRTKSSVTSASQSGGGDMQVSLAAGSVLVDRLNASEKSFTVTQSGLQVRLEPLSSVILVAR